MTETYQKFHDKKRHSATLVHDPSTEFEFPEFDSFDGHETSSQNRRKYEKKDRSRKVSEIQTDDRICPECNGTLLHHDEITGDLICTQCGMVLDAHMFLTDKSSLTFTNSDDSESQKSSSVYTSTDPIGEKLFQKLQKAEKWTHTWADIHQIIVKKEINRYIYQLEIPEYVAENAQNLYAKIYRKNAIQGRGIRAMVAATVYTICREHQVPVFFQDIERISKQEHSTIRKCFSYIMDNFPIKLPLLNAKQFIPQLVSKLGFSELLEKLSVRILDKLESTDWGERINNPKHMAAISIFFGYNILKKINKLNIEITQKEFSTTVGMSETTLRKYKRIFQTAISINM